MGYNITAGQAIKINNFLSKYHLSVVGRSTTEPEENGDYFNEVLELNNGWVLEKTVMVGGGTSWGVGKGGTDERYDKLEQALSFMDKNMR